MAFVPLSLRAETSFHVRKKPRLCSVKNRGHFVCLKTSRAEGGSDATVSPDPPTPTSSVSLAQVSQFRSWASAEKVRYPHLEIANFDSLRGMQATTPLVRNAPVMSVPASAVLQTSTLDSARSPLPGDVCDESWKNLPWFARLALKLHFRKRTPEWRPWVDLLPSTFDTPFHWAEVDIAELQSPRLAQLIYWQRKSYRKMYDELCADSRNKGSKSMSYADFVWAVECVRSRAFAGPQEVAPFKARFQLVLFAAFNTFTWPALNFLDWDKAINGGLTAILALVLYDLLFPKILKTVQNVELRRYALAPGIDFLNHSSDMSTAATVAYEYFLDRFVVRSRQDYVSGEQVFISYGAQSNDSLLQYYGFVDGQNPSDDYVFGEGAEKLLKVSPGTLRVLGNGSFSQSAMKQISESLEGGEKEIGQVLSKLCRLELDGFETTVEEDLELLKSPNLTKPREVAIRYRLGKKNVLREAQKFHEQLVQENS